MGERFGNYEIMRRLASGGMAEVLLAKQRSFGGFERLVCLKRILPHLGRQEDFLKMFQDEARIAANLIHPNVAQIYDIAEEDGRYFIAMEYVRGEDLRRVYNQEVGRGQTIPRPVAAQVAMGAAAGLDYAHRQQDLDGNPLGIVHRDISPQNIVVTYDGYVKLIDFGVAKAAGKLIETRSGVLKGKYSYMSPEQASGDPVDGRTDIFALGITLYEITTGSRLFKRDNELETLHAVIACNVVPPHEIVPGYDRDLEAIIMRALAYDAEQRYTTAGELERELEHYLQAHGHPTSAGALASYMHDLFAEKLADEALFGGPPWSEPATHSSLVAQQRASRAAAAAAAPPADDGRTAADRPANAWEPPPGDPDEPPSTAAAAAAGGDWSMEVMPLEKTISNVLEAQGTEVSDQPPAPAPMPMTTAVPPLAPTVNLRRAPRRLPLLLLGLAGVVAGAALLRHARNPGPNSVAALPKPKADEASLEVLAPFPVEVEVAGRPLGITPLPPQILPRGPVHLLVRSRHEGLEIDRRLVLAPGQALAVDLSQHMGQLVVEAEPWAWVQIGGRTAMETPVRERLVAGDYTVRLECPEGRRELQHIKISSGDTAVVRLRC